MFSYRGNQISTHNNLAELVNRSEQNGLTGNTEDSFHAEAEGDGKTAI